MHAYKVTDKNGNSAFAGYSLRKHYTVGEVTSADAKALEQGYGLLAFRNLETAMDFACQQLVHWKLLFVTCRKADVMKLPKFRCCLTISFAKLWRLKDISHDAALSLDWAYPQWPRGTVMVKRLKVIREVNYA
jgi:hypothetical protein